MRLRSQASGPLIILIVCLGVFVAALDQTVVVTALPSIMFDIKLPLTRLDQASWIITGYLLGYTVAMPLMGRISDVYGHPRIYQVALVFFALGSLMVALSSSLHWIVASRVVQAVGGGATVPIGMAIVSGVLPGHRRGIALGIIAAAAEAGSVMGPLYGGGIIRLMDWRWIFWLNLPLSAGIIVLLALLPNRRQPQQRVDYTGGLLLAAVLITLSLGLSRREAFNLSSAVPFLLMAGGLALAVSLWWAERRAQMPLLAPFMFRSWAFISANATQLLVGVALIIAMVTIPLMTDTVMGKEPLEGGLRLMRLTGAIPVGAVLGGLLSLRLGVRLPTVIGLLLMAAGFYLLSGWGVDIAEPQLTLHLVVAGLGFGLVIAPIMTTALGAVPQAYSSTAASLVTVARMVGMTLGLAALSAWGMQHFQTLTTGVDFRDIDYLDKATEASLTIFHNFFRAAAIVSLVAIVPALKMKAR